MVEIDSKISAEENNKEKKENEKKRTVPIITRLGRESKKPTKLDL